MALNTAAYAAAQTYWVALPHTNIASDLAKVAQQLKTSGVATQTYVSDNAITATLTNGSKFLLVYDDRDAASGANGWYADNTAAPAAVRTTTAKIQSVTPTIPDIPYVSTLLAGTSTKHEIAFLINDDDPWSFAPSNQLLMGNAFARVGLPAAYYEVDVLHNYLDSVVRLGSTHPIDYLNMAMHGSVSCKPDGTNCDYYWVANQTADLTDWHKYYTDIQKGYVGAAGLLKLSSIHDAETFDFRKSGVFWFTPEFLTAHLQFNPGAVVINSSCYGADPKTIAATTATFAAAGVGLYSGWTGPARGWDADQSDVYLLDRLLGEQLPTETELGTLSFYRGEGDFLPLVTQRTPAQRPFPLTDVIAAMQTTQRPPNPKTSIAGPITFTQATELGGSQLVFTTLNGGGANSDVIIWGLPSISNMEVIEKRTGGTLIVNGSFPASPGTGQIVDASGTYPLTPTSWSTTRVQFSLPPTGNGAAGLVTIFSKDGVASNAVPLTEWKGQLFVTVNNSMTNMNGWPGTGSGTITTTTNLHFRADVHPVVTKIDTAALKQNFVFNGLMGDATTTVTSADVRFASVDNTKTAQFSLTQPVKTETPIYAAPITPGNFIVSPYTGNGASTSCNSGVAGPEAFGPTNVFCPFGGIYAVNALTCTDNNGSLCQQSKLDYIGYYGYPPFVGPGSGVVGDDGLLLFTMNPTTYAITFTSQPASLVFDYLFATDDNITINLSATIQPPINAPDITTQASIMPPAALTGSDLLRLVQLQLPASQCPDASSRTGNHATSFQRVSGGALIKNNAELWGVGAWQKARCRS